MPGNRYAVGDWRNATAQVPADVKQFAAWSQSNPQIQAILANPRYAGNSPAQRRARQAAIHQVVVANGQHIPQGLKINADGQLETDDQTGMPGWAKALIIGGGAAAAVFGIPALAGVLGSSAGAAGAGEAAGAAGALGPSTAASIADTAAIAGGSTVPASLAALTPAELAAEGGAAGAGAGTAATLGTTAATDANTFVGPTTTGLVDAAGTPIVQGANPSVLSNLGNWLGGNPSLVNTGIGVAGQLLGAKIQSGGLADAAAIEAKVQEEALNYEKQRDAYLSQLEQGRYADANARFAPYLGLGQSAADRLGSILGLSTTGPTLSTPPAVPGAPTPVNYQTRTGLDTSQTPVGTAIPRPGGPLPNPNTGQPNQPAQPPSRVSAMLTPPAPQAGTVLMQAPTGELRQVPVSQLAHYTSIGAVQVNA